MAWRVRKLKCSGNPFSWLFAKAMFICCVAMSTTLLAQTAYHLPKTTEKWTLVPKAGARRSEFAQFFAICHYIGRPLPPCYIPYNPPAANNIAWLLRIPLGLFCQCCLLIYYLLRTDDFVKLTEHQ